MPELILGAILGILFTAIYEKIIAKKFRQNYINRLSKIRHEIYNDNKIRRFVFEYYRKNESFSDLYECQIQGYSEKILFLTNSRWCGKDIDIYRIPTVLTQVDSAPLQYQINSNMIKRRKLIGQKLFDDKALYLSRILPTGEIEAKICSFFQKLTLIDKLENETLKAAKSKIDRSTKVRDAILRNFESALVPMSQPISLGCHVVFVLQMDGEPFVALHKRSEETFTYGGSMASVPVFGMVPMPSCTTTNVSDTLKNNVLFYNIIKEYCEELHDEAVLQGKDNHSNPFWFYEKINEARELISSLEKKESHCRFLGYGFDAINGLSILAALLYVKDENLAKNIYDNCKSNWEIANEEVLFYRLSDQNLRRFLEDSRYQNGTAFALSLAMQAIEHL